MLLHVLKMFRRMFSSLQSWSASCPPPQDSLKQPLGFDHLFSNSAVVTLSLHTMKVTVLIRYDLVCLEEGSLYDALFERRSKLSIPLL